MATGLAELSQSLAAIVESLGPSVVRVEGRRRLDATGLVWSSDGLIVTADHVVRRDEELQVGLADGTSQAVAVVGRDPATDLALLRASVKGMTPAPWLEPDDIKVGYLALALGRPGRTVQATLGIVSALGDEWRTSEGGTVDHYLQSDVVMYPGFSGGPLVGTGGKVLGLNSSALVRGISIALPAPTVRRTVETLLAHGHVRRGYLGVGAQPVRLPEPVAKDLGQETGILLLSVEPGSPAAKAGLVLGDTIVGLGGSPIRHMDDLMGALGDDAVGKSMAARVLRSGELVEKMLVIAERK
jgi:S1-C subfamily serine protease